MIERRVFTTKEHDAHAELSKAAAEYERLVTTLLPESRERSLILTKIDESTMWVGAAIAKSGIK